MNVLCCVPGATGGVDCRRGRVAGALLALIVSLAWGSAAFAATIANHMDYPAEGFALWCQDSQQRWVEHKLTGHLDMEQHVSVPLPEEPCLFLEADMGDYLLSFPVKQELGADDLLDMGCMPDPTLEVYRDNEPLFIADGTEKDRGLARDPDRNPPETIQIGNLLDTFKGGMSEADCLNFGIPLRRERFNDSQNFSIKTSLSSEGIIWQGVISLYRDTDTAIIGLTLGTQISRAALEKLFAALSARGYRHTMLGDNGPVYPDDPLLNTDADVRARGVADLLAQLEDPNSDPYDAHFEPGSPECRENVREVKPAKVEKPAKPEKSRKGEKARAEKTEKAEMAEHAEKAEKTRKKNLCRDLGVDVRIAPGSERVELFLQEGEEPAE